MLLALALLFWSSFTIRYCAVLLPLVWSTGEGILILKHERKTLGKIIANKTMGHLVVLVVRAFRRRMTTILTDSTHPHPIARTNRFKFSFVPSAVSMF